MESETKSQFYYAKTLAIHVLSKLDPNNGRGTKEQQSVLHALVLMLAGEAVEQNGSAHGVDKFMLFAKEATRYADSAAANILLEHGIALTEQQTRLIKSSDLSCNTPFSPNSQTSTGWDKYSDIRRELNNVLIPIFRQQGGSQPVPSGKSLLELWDKTNQAMWEIQESKDAHFHILCFILTSIHIVLPVTQRT
jgi:hypothetical protein